MDVLCFSICKELMRLGLEADSFNHLPDRQKMAVFNNVRFTIKTEITKHGLPAHDMTLEGLKRLDKKIASVLFESKISTKKS